MGDALGGKTVRCRNCAVAIQVPTELDPEPASVVGSIQDMSRPATTVEDIAEVLTTPTRTMEVSRPAAARTFSFPSANYLDRNLAPILCVIGYGLAAMHAILGGSGLAVLSFGVGVLFTLSGSVVGIMIGANFLNLPLPRQLWLRTAAVLAVPSALRALLFAPSSEWTAYITAGWLLGLVPAYFVFWFLFRLDERRAALAFVFVVTAATAGSALAASVMSLALLTPMQPIVPAVGPIAQQPESQPVAKPQPSSPPVDSPPASPSVARELVDPAFQVPSLVESTQRAYLSLHSLTMEGTYRERTIVDDRPTERVHRFAAWYERPNRFRLDYHDLSITDAAGTALSPYESFTLCTGTKLYRGEGTAGGTYVVWDVPPARFTRADKIFAANGHLLDAVATYDPALLFAITPEAIPFLLGKRDQARHLEDATLDGKQYTALQFEGNDPETLALLIDPDTHLIRRASYWRTGVGGERLMRIVDYTSVKADEKIDPAHWEWILPESWAQLQTGTPTAP